MMSYSVASYPFCTLFKLPAAAGQQATADQFCLGREEAEVLPSGSLDAMLSRLSARRRGVKIVVPVVPVVEQDPERVIALADGPVGIIRSAGTSMGSNDTLDTLESSVDMLSPMEAAKLSITNAPVMKPFGKRPTSVKSV